MVKQLLLTAGAGLLGMLLLLRLVDGTAGFLVQGWYRPILFVSSLGLIALAAGTWLRAARSGERLHIKATGAGLTTAVLVAAPVLLGFAFKPQPLGTNSLNSDTDGSRQFGASVGTADANLRNIYQWAYEFQSSAPADLVGQPIEVVGFVYHKKEESPDHFQVARFVVACCVADAQGFSLPVQWKDAAALANNSWVKVTGRVATGPDGAPLIQASAIDGIEAPSNPYIYP
jgi:uncharacterized repeat protein (TIGR03943 family)